MKKGKPSKINIRKRWRINPKTRVVKNKKVYSRKKIKPVPEDIAGNGINEA